MIAQRFTIQISSQLILHNARQQRFTSFNALTRLYGIADQDWAFVYTLLFQHLNKMVDYCFEHNLPCLPCLVIAKKNLKTGEVTQRQLTRLSKAMLQAGYTSVMGATNIQQHQIAAMEWAGDFMQDFHTLQIEKGKILPAFKPLSPKGKEIYMVK